MWRPSVILQPHLRRHFMLCSRAHPSVVAYSVENESGDEVIPELIDAASLADPSRPLTTEGSGNGFFFNGTSKCTRTTSTGAGVSCAFSAIRCLLCPCGVQSQVPTP